MDYFLHTVFFVVFQALSAMDAYQSDVGVDVWSLAVPIDKVQSMDTRRKRDG